MESGQKDEVLVIPENLTLKLAIIWVAKHEFHNELVAHFVHAFTLLTSPLDLFNRLVELWGELDLHYPVLHVLSEWLIYHPKHFQTKFLHSLLTSFWDDMVALDSNCCHLYFLYVVFVLV